jgi:glycogen(starch) synthase
MHVLMTTDTAGGVWTFTRELASGLSLRGDRITLVSLGPPPTRDQLAWLEGVRNVTFLQTNFRLEWMQDSADDIAASRAWLSAVVRRTRPDVVHFNQYAYGDLECGVPKVIVAHSDVVSWWLSVHGELPRENGWLRWYCDLVVRGISHADAVVTPSQWMLNALRRYYAWPDRAQVIHNGRDGAFFSHQTAKEDFVLSVGRVWDQGKQMSLLGRTRFPVPIYVAGPERSPDGTGSNASCLPCGIQILGCCSEEQLHSWYGRASTYAATSRYEPFGLAPLEAALSRCALVANDIPVFHEIWGDAAFYFRTNDADSLASAVRFLQAHPDPRQFYADRAYERASQVFSTARMLEQYQQLYRTLLDGGGSRWTN